MARPRLPTALKVVGGTARSNRFNAHEPEPMLVTHEQAQTPPAHLSGRSADVWREVAPMLRSIQVLTVADLLALEMLCDQVADYRYARAQRGDKFVASSSTGSQMLSQWLVASQMAGKQARELWGRFGMDPQSRSRLTIDPQGDLFGGTPDAKPGKAAAADPSRFFARK